MAYKKYIKRNGKVYGPYVYHSRRVNGKVVSEYRGQKKDINYSKIGYAFLGLFALVILLYGASHLDFSMTGQAILNLDAQYTEGEPIQGNLKLFVKQGELIPMSSKIIFETDADYYEYNLEDLLDNGVIEGDYYVEGKSINGVGAGYGIEGIREVYPEVYFSLNIISDANSKTSEGFDVDNDDTVVLDELIVNNSETTIEEPEIIEPEESIEEDAEETIEEPESNEEEPIQIEEIAPLTGGVISGFFSRFTPTGKVTLGIENTIEGSVEYGDKYVKDLLEEQEVELVEGSVKTLSVNLEDGDISINRNNVGVLITTDYYEIERGFGKEYLGDNLEVLDINLDELNMLFNKGELRVRIMYGEEEITSLTTSLVEEGSINVDVDSYVEEEKAEEIGGEVEGNKVVNVGIREEIKLKGLPEFLTAQEKEILIAEFGQKEIEISTGFAGEGQIKVRFKLEGYWFVEVYYVSLSKEELALQMDMDKTEWLKEVINSI